MEISASQKGGVHRLRGYRNGKRRRRAIALAKRTKNFENLDQATGNLEGRGGRAAAEVFIRVNLRILNFRDTEGGGSEL